MSINIRIIVLLMAILSAFDAFAQQKDTQRIVDSIVNEGKTLYRSEWASWYGTDVFMEKCKDRRDQIAGYLSYETTDGVNNIFFSKGDTPSVLATTSLGKDFNYHSYKLDTIKRNFTEVEQGLYNIRKAALNRINSDTVFKYYKNTSLNPVPIIINGVKKVYVLTGTSLQGLVILGNDYLLSFDKDGSVASVKKIHKSIIPVKFERTGIDTGSKISIVSMHTHLPETGEFITATDICTLMLYEKLTTWHQHMVLSKNYVSIWDCINNKLSIFTTAEWEKSNQLKSALKGGGN